MATKYTNSNLVSYTKISPNKTSPRKYKLTRITVHCFVGQVTVERGCQVFADPDRKASCNYVIAKDGKIGLVVDERDRSWCSSSADNDNRAITIEVASDTVDPYKVNDDAYNALINLLVDICRRYDKKKLLWFADKQKTLAYQPADDELVMTVHRWFAAKSCPGAYLYNRHSEIASTVTKILNDGNIVVTDTAKKEVWHTVVKGESLSKIGKLYSVNWKDIAKMNNIKAPFYIIRVGQKLRIK